MANLVCWASGLLEIMTDKDTPLDGGPVVLAHGTMNYMRGLMVAHGEFREYSSKVFGWYVPGTKPMPRDPDEAVQAQRDNMTLVIAFNEKINKARRRAS